jgi:flagellar hook-basal body complex protein FliE
MPDPIQFQNLSNIGRIAGPGTGPSAPGQADKTSGSFSQTLIQSLEEVKRLQDEAAASTNRLLTGETKNPDEVFSAIRKADVAFDLLMEMRNKLLDAYRELKEMHV